MFDAARADDGAGDAGVMGGPGDGQADRVFASCIGKGREFLCGFIVPGHVIAFLIHLVLHQTGAFGALTATILARQQATGIRAIGDDRQVFGLCQGQDFNL